VALRARAQFVRREPERAQHGLVERAAGDLLADGIPVLPETRGRVVDLLLHEVAAENEAAPEALRILGELSLDAEVLERMAGVARSPEASWWTRALVADRIADVDVATGHELLRAVAQHADEVLRAWIVDTLHERGGQVDPTLRVPLAADAAPANRSLGTLGRYALTQRVADTRASDTERFAAAVQLAAGEDLAPLRAMAGATDLDAFERVRPARALADAGEPGLLRELSAAGPPHARYAAALALFDRGDPAAGPALSAVADEFPGRPMAFGAAARCAELGDRDPLSRLAARPGQVELRLCAARRLAALGDVRALRRLLDEPLEPGIEAAALASLVEAGETDLAPRLRRLVRARGLRSRLRVRLRYLLAWLGDRQSGEVLRRLARRGVIEAAVALAELSDPAGPARLRSIACGRGRPGRDRLRAAAGLFTVRPADGLDVLTRLAGPGERTKVRLRAATVALTVTGSAGPLTALAFDDGNPVTLRIGAVDALAMYRAETARLIGLARAETTPARIRVAAAVALPPDEAAALLTGIATGDPRLGTRVAAIDALELLDEPAAGELFGRLVRDRRFGSLRRRVVLVRYRDFLPGEDAGWVRLVLRDPERTLSRPGASAT